MPRMIVSLAEAKIIRHMRHARAQAKKDGVEVSPAEVAEAMTELIAEPERAVEAIGASEESKRADSEAAAAERDAQEAADAAEAAAERAREAQESARQRREAAAAVQADAAAKAQAKAEQDLADKKAAE